MLPKLKNKNMVTRNKSFKRKRSSSLWTK